MLTSDPIYNKPYKPQITIKDTANAITYYDYNPWTDSGTTNKPIHLSLNLSENTHGKFVCQIEDGGKTLNRNNINKGARLIIKVGKQSSQMTTVMSGLIREVADSRGSDRKDLYTLIGSSTSIRNNERIIYYIKQAEKLASDGITIDINDPNMKAVLLLVQAYAGANSIQPNYGSEGSLGILDISSTTANSNVNNFIADIAIEFGEIQDAINVIEEQSNSELVINTSDDVNLRYELTRLAGGRGFTIKNKTYRITGIDDDADDTMYLIRKNWKYSDSCYKSDSYANRISGIMPAETEPSKKEDCGFWSGATSGWFYGEGSGAGGFENGYKFKPTHSRWYPGDIYVVGCYLKPVATPVWTVRFRILSDTAGVPTNAGGVIANIDFPAERECFGSTINLQPPASDPAWTLSNDQVFYNASNTRIDTFNLDTTKDYWFLASAANVPNTGTPQPQFCIPPKPDEVTSTVAFHDTNYSTNTAGGSAYTVSLNFVTPVIAFPRKRSQVLVMHDPKAIRNLGSGLSTGGTPIESHLPSFPNIIKTKEAGFSYAINQLYYMAKPRANYSIPAVTAPNIPPLPGDPIVIMDTVLGFSTSGNKVIFTRCGDYNLTWGSLDGSGLTYQAPTKLNINPVGVIPRYK